ncbi:MAG: metallophosphoesterase [Cystobacterineae bacterium]|nr:metallophosphoesterase [Cystobacterineae bacterium]
MHSSFGSSAFFILALFPFLGVGTYFLCSRWRRPLSTKLIIIATVWLLWLTVLSSAGWHSLSHTWLRPVMGAMSRMGYVGLSLLFYFSCAMLLSGLVLWLLRLFWEPSLLLRQRVRALCAAGAVGICGYGFWVAAKGPQLVEHEVELSKLSPAFDNFRVAVVSDIHLGPMAGRAFSEQLVEKLNALEADVIAIIGDLVDGSVESLAADVAPFKKLRARHGVLFVTGNHEYFTGAAEAWVEHLKGLGFWVLGNERVEIEHPTADADGAAPRLAFAGVHDLYAGRTPHTAHRTDLRAALAGWDIGVPLVLLAHQPNLWKAAQAAGVDLMLSGHTHGGQMWPINHLLAWSTPVVQGWYREENSPSQLYVSTGAGQWGPPLRIGAPPEMALLRLRAPAP